MKLHISLRRNPSEREFITFENVNPESFVAELKANIAQKAEVSPQSIRKFIIYISYLNH